MIYLIHAMGLACFAATVVPLSKHEAWWVRSCDFPRVQIVVLALTTLALLVISADLDQTTNRLLLATLIAVVVYQATVILPYTPLWPVELLSCPDEPSNTSLRIVIVNVLMPNRRTDRLFRVVRDYDPDLLLAVETDAWWCEQLETLAPDFPYRLVHPLDNTYGMLLYSKLELVGPEIRFLLDPEIPSIRTGVRLRSGHQIRLYGLHPEPPSPNEADSSLPRDGELVLVGREVAAAGTPTIVAGDLNDVAWSHTSRLFRRLSRLLDPRIGRGIFNTFHAGLWLLRWPLDHVFVSQEFVLQAIRRLPAFGSDHFPIFIVVEHHPPAADLHEPPEADHDDHADADDKLERLDVDPNAIEPR